MPFRQRGVKYLGYINAKYSVLLGLISAEGKHVRMYFKPIKQTWVIAMDASLGRVTPVGVWATGASREQDAPLPLLPALTPTVAKLGGLWGRAAGLRVTSACLCLGRWQGPCTHRGMCIRGCAAPRSIRNPTRQPGGHRSPSLVSQLFPAAPTPKHTVRLCLLSRLTPRLLLLGLPYFYKVDFRVSFKTIMNS